MPSPIRPYVVSFVAFLIAGAALAQAPATRVLPYPIDLPEDYLAAVEKGTRTHKGHPGPKHWTNYAHYDIAMELDVVRARVKATAKMTYLNRSPDELRSLQVHLRQNVMAPGAARLFGVRPNEGVELGTITVDGEETRSQLRGTTLRLRLAEEIRPGGEVEVVIEYAYDVPEAGTAPRNGHEEDKVFYLAYWYPQFAVYDDVEGWVAERYLGPGEFYMGYADYDLAITAPQGYLVRATGVLQNPEEVLTEKARKALAKARTSRDIVHVVGLDDLDAGNATAKAPAGSGGKLTWKFRAENVRDAAVSIARTYLWDATHAVVPNQKGDGKDGITMIHAVYESGSGDWVRAAEYERHTIEYMSRMVHPFPWPHMTACEGIVGGGMEFPMMTICGGRRPHGVIAHELIHSWFPMLVGSNEKRHAWMDEGFTSFWTNLCVDDFNGRVNGSKRAILGYAHSIRRGGDGTCMQHADFGGGGFTAYSKPAAVLHQLRAMLGDDTFFGAFRRYTRDWAFKHPTPYDFFHAFSDHAGQDLGPYFRTWLFETWRLEHAVGAVTDEGKDTKVVIEDRGRAMHPCVVEVTYEDDSTQRQVVSLEHWRSHTKAELTFEGKPVRVEIDPGMTSLDIDRDNNVWRRGK